MLDIRLTARQLVYLLHISEVQEITYCRAVGGGPKLFKQLAQLKLVNSIVLDDPYYTKPKRNVPVVCFTINVVGEMFCRWFRESCRQQHLLLESGRLHKLAFSIHEPTNGTLVFQLT